MNNRHKLAVCQFCCDEVMLILKGGVMSTDNDLQVDQWDAVIARAPLRYLLIAPYRWASNAQYLNITSTVVSLPRSSDSRKLSP
jgi:hypothetical protein